MDLIEKVVSDLACSIKNDVERKRIDVLMKYWFVFDIFEEEYAKLIGIHSPNDIQYKLRFGKKSFTIAIETFSFIQYDDKMCICERYVGQICIGQGISRDWVRQHIVTALMCKQFRML